MLIERAFTLDLRFFNCLILWCCYGYWNVKNIANFVNMALKSFFLMRTWKVSAQIQLLFQNSITIWIIKHRNIGNIPSTGVAMGTDLFFLKLSQNTQSIAFRLITLYLLNRICCFLLKRKVQISAHFQQLFQKSIITWNMKHRNIGNIYSTGVAIGTDLFLLKLSWSIQLTAFCSITLYVFNRILSNL